MSIIYKDITTVWFIAGLRGNALYRILCAHPEVYWNPVIQQSSIELLNHPLDLPETVSSFNITTGDPTVIEERQVGNLPNLQFGYTTYHTAGMLGDINTLKIIEQWITSNSYLDKKLFITCHPIDKNNINNAKDVLLLDNKICIWLYGTINRLGIKHIYIEPFIDSLVYNLNIDALFSTDYATFETEYFKLIAHFNLTSCLNRVRAFILLALERENYISKFY